MSPSNRSPIGNAEQSRVSRLNEAFELYLVVPGRVLWSDWRARVGSLIIAGYVLTGTLGVFLVPEARTNQGDLLVPPFHDPTFPLGTDGLGQGIFRQIVHATPAMLMMILAGATFTVVLAGVVGTLAGYEGGHVDSVLMTVADMVMTVPGLPLIIVVSAFFKPSHPALVGIILSINAWAGLARSIRSEVLTLRHAAYVEADRLMGLRRHTILFEDVLPNLMPYITMNFVQTARNIIFASVALYFLGILPANTFNWGVMMNLAYQTAGALYTLESAHWLVSPMIAIVGLSLALTLFAQGADRLFNPRIRARHAGSTTDTKTEIHE